MESTVNTPVLQVHVPPLPCPHCGTIDHPVVRHGVGPHYASASCAHCGTFLQWLSQYTPEERQARRAAARQAAMGPLPPSPLQLAYLQALGYTGIPATMGEASRKIDALKGKAGQG